MSKNILALALLAVFFAITGVAAAETNEKIITNFTLMGGQRSLNSSDWKPVETQTFIGGDFDFRYESWPASMFVVLAAGQSSEATGYLSSYPGITFKVKSSFTEVDVGARKYFNEEQNLRPYLGAGLGMANYTFDVTATKGTASASAAGSGSGVGLLLNAGLLWRIERIIIGGDVRMLTGSKVSIGSASITGDYTQLGLILGFVF
ncbi:MAG: hypothetical protein HZB29_01915 [Nitrospinae bacterium]|nr:hypothetical protein [Nitrospinota bacterium]